MIKIESEICIAKIRYVIDETTFAYSFYSLKIKIGTTIAVYLILKSYHEQACTGYYS